jgi:transposase
VERAVARHHQYLSAAVTAQPEPGAQNRPAEPPAAPAPRSDRVAVRTRARHAGVHRLLAAGRSHPQIAAELGISRNTVRRFARTVNPEELLVRDGTGRRPRALDDYEPYLRQRWNSGCTNAAQLHQEIRDRGYPGSARAVRGYLARFRGNETVPPPAAAPPKIRAVTCWIMTRPGTLDAGDKASLDAILAASPELAAVAARVREFAEIMTERRGQELKQWTASADTADEPALKSFVTGLRTDQDAVTAGLTLPWSSGSVEGNVNRIKMLKRQMYGRASPDLLRLRVLLAD